MKTSRPDDEKLRLAIEVADDIAMSPGLLFPFKIKVVLQPTQSFVIDEPERRALRDLLSVARKLHMPSHDARLADIFPILEKRGLVPPWDQQLPIVQGTAASVPSSSDDIGRVYALAELEVVDRGPREAFEQWAYGEVIHDDWDKILAWRALGPAQWIHRKMAHDYLWMLVNKSRWVAQAIRVGLAVPLDPPPPEPPSQA